MFTDGCFQRCHLHVPDRCIPSNTVCQLLLAGEGKIIARTENTNVKCTLCDFSPDFPLVYSFWREKLQISDKSVSNWQSTAICELFKDVIWEIRWCIAEGQTMSSSLHIWTCGVKGFVTEGRNCTTLITFLLLTRFFTADQSTDRHIHFGREKSCPMHGITSFPVSLLARPFVTKRISETRPYVWTVQQSDNFKGHV